MKSVDFSIENENFSYQMLKDILNNRSAYDFSEDSTF
jgi:hypothetical protein